eukprot:c56680_g1_i1 orf=1-678(+)
MSKALIAKKLLKGLTRSIPWTKYLWSFMDKVRQGLGISWQNLSVEDVLLSSLPVTLKHSDLLGGLLKTFKEVGQHICWKGLPKENADSSLNQSVWWAKNLVSGQQPGLRWKKEAMAISKKGICSWQQLWNVPKEEWWSSEVVRQRFKLTNKEAQVVKMILAAIPDGFPTNTNIARRQPVLEWCWKNGECLIKTKTRTAYKLLSRNESWHIPLNVRWNREDDLEWW